MFTRQSLLWSVMMVVGVLATLGGHLIEDEHLLPWLSPGWRHALELLGLIATALGGKMGWSPLPLSRGGAGAGSVDPSRFIGNGDTNDRGEK